MKKNRPSYFAVFLLLACVHVCSGSARVYKAKAPKDYKDVQQEELGSIFGEGITLFGGKKETSSIKSDSLNAIPASCQSGREKALKIVQDVKNPLSKKDRMWQASLQVLSGLSIAYANKETGIIKTDEAYIHDFDSTVSCKYKITINVSDSGDVFVFIKSGEDSDTRLKKHQEALKNKITTLAKESS
ncbi:MAG: hypothetical protein LBG13_01190 [Holosporales bacterium]|jgi:hypothetical protein|nr:hypothetical protein [Holosporales bacterium]